MKIPWFGERQHSIQQVFFTDRFWMPDARFPAFSDLSFTQTFFTCLSGMLPYQPVCWRNYFQEETVFARITCKHPANNPVEFFHRVLLSPLLVPDICQPTLLVKAICCFWPFIGFGEKAYKFLGKKDDQKPGTAYLFPFLHSKQYLQNKQVDG